MQKLGQLLEKGQCRESQMLAQGSTEAEKGESRPTTVRRAGLHYLLTLLLPRLAALRKWPKQRTQLGSDGS